MKRLIFAAVMALLFFLLLNFIYCNLDEQTFGYSVSFKFMVPHLFAFRSVPIPMGFCLLLAFSSGMVAIALIEALPSFFKTLEIRSKNKKIRQLERELSIVREMGERRQASETEMPVASKD